MRAGRCLQRFTSGESTWSRMVYRWCRVAACEFVPVMTVKSNSKPIVENVVAALAVVGERLTT